MKLLHHFYSTILVRPFTSLVRPFTSTDDMYRMPFQTCRDRAKEALGDCCLKVGRKMDTTTRGVLKVEFYK